MMGPQADKVCWIIFFTQDWTGQISYNRLLLSVSECCLGLHGPGREWNRSRRDYWRAGNKPTHHRVAGKGWASCNKSNLILKAIEISHTVYLACHTWTQSHIWHRCAWTSCAHSTLDNKRERIRISTIFPSNATNIGRGAGTIQISSSTSQTQFLNKSKQGRNLAHS
jgi:hypothetical protein